MKAETQLQQRDHRVIWHPYTQHLEQPALLEVASAKGAWITDPSGRRYLDMISSWWVNIHGHGRGEFAEALSDQVRLLDHVHFAGTTHETAVTLAEELLSRAGFAADDKVFFSDNGSTAVEVALKTTLQYWGNQGQERPLVIGLKGAYHGDTLGAMSAGATCGYFDAFGKWMFEMRWLDAPYCWWEHDPLLEETAALKALDILLEKEGGSIAAFILEPLVQGAIGMKMYRACFLRGIAERLKQWGIPLIADEVMTGFGRTGSFLASQGAGVSADIVCLSKGITGGILPFAATLFKNHIFDKFLAEGFPKALAHGHSYAGNPLACRVALESLRLFDKLQSLERVRQLSGWLQEGLRELTRNLPQIEKPRVIGAIAAFDVTTGSNRYGGSFGRQIAKLCQEKGVLIRPLGNTIYLMPPYCCTREEVSLAFEAIKSALTE
ncbi:MAG: adenosylmethionine--8-amino-7-oxononanoate transaminase [Verrucomicrobiota bacterium]